MKATQNPIQQYSAACQAAREHGLFVVPRGERYLVFRRMPNRNVLVGDCGTVASLARTVNRCAGSHQP